MLSFPFFIFSHSFYKHLESYISDGSVYFVFSNQEATSTKLRTFTIISVAPRTVSDTLLSAQYMVDD